eukprot:2040036-Pyramimonas_sp.AAC.1
MAARAALSVMEATAQRNAATLQGGQGQGGSWRRGGGGRLTTNAEDEPTRAVPAVSYTHLTLPTILLV